jgi:hypothetical protein
VLVATERRATTALFAASVAHDINNVLTVANAHVARLGEETLSEDQHKRSSVAMTKTLGDLTALSKRLLAIESRCRSLPPRAETSD